MRDSRDAELVQEMRYLCVSYSAYSKGIVFGIGHALGCRLLFSRSPVDHSSEGDDQSTCRCIVVWASSIVRIDITSKCAHSECAFFKYSSITQRLVLCAVKVPKHALESYHILIARVLITVAENSDCLINIGPSGSRHIHQASDHRLAWGRIAGFFVRFSLVKLHRHWHGNWSGLV